MSKVAPVELNQTFDRAGATVRWGRVGQGPPVVLCHGTPWSSYVWRFVSAELESTRSVYVFDMVGYGESAMIDTDVSLDAQGRLLASLIDHWALDSPDVIAHDFGGAVALRAHLLHETPVRSLALVDVVALRPWGSPFFKLVKEHAHVFGALPSNLHEALVREYIAGASSPGLDAEVLTRLVRPWASTVGQAAFYRQIAQADEALTDEIEALYDTIRVPTLIIWGSDDVWIPPEQAARLHAMIPGSRLELVEGAGHLIQEDRPNELATLLVEWIESRGR